MPLAPRDFAAGLLAEARQTHPWLHHPLFRMIAISEFVRERLVYIGMPREKIRLVYNGINDAQFAPNEDSRRWLRLSTPGGCRSTNWPL